MDQENLDYLKKSLMYNNFGESLNKDIELNISRQRDRFQIPVTAAFGKDTVNYSLDFGRSEKNDRYYFNNYTATLKNDDPAKERTHTFYMKNNQVTALEAHALLKGGSVFKTNLTTADDKKYSAWMKIDFDAEKDKNNNHPLRKYGEDKGPLLEQAFAKHPDIKEWNNPSEKARISEALKRGHNVIVTADQDGVEEKRIISMNAKFKNLDVLAPDGNRVFQGINIIKNGEEGKVQNKSTDTAQNTTSDKSSSQDLSSSSEKNQSSSKEANDSVAKNEKKSEGEKKSDKKKKGMGV